MSTDQKFKELKGGVKELDKTLDTIFPWSHAAFHFLQRFVVAYRCRRSRGTLPLKECNPRFNGVVGHAWSPGTDWSDFYELVIRCCFRLCYHDIFINVPFFQLLLSYPQHLTFGCDSRGHLSVLQRNSMITRVLCRGKPAHESLS